MTRTEFAIISALIAAPIIIVFAVVDASALMLSGAVSVGVILAIETARQCLRGSAIRSKIRALFGRE